jgi:hypothetical protein
LKMDLWYTEDERKKQKEKSVKRGIEFKKRKKKHIELKKRKKKNKK